LPQGLERAVNHYRPFLKWPVFICLAILLLNTAQFSFAAEDALKKALDTNQASLNEAAASQKKIDSLSEETQQLYADYKSTLRQLQSFQIYNQNLEQLVESQKQEIKSYDTQFAQIDDTQRDVIPLMIKMVDTLEDFIRLDQPFLLNERQNRVAELKALMSRSDVATSEKYRRVMEAYQVEMEYGRTIEAYRGALDTSGEKRTVNFFRLGRVALYYQTLDEQETGMWDKAAKNWVQLDSDYRLPVSKGLGIARKQAAPDLLILPVNVAEQAQ